MAWLHRKSASVDLSAKGYVPDRLWMKCPGCKQILQRQEVEANVSICKHCDHHFPLSALKRIALLIDDGSFSEKDADLASLDLLAFEDKSPYIKRLHDAKKRSKRHDAIVCGSGKINGIDVELGVFDFEFMGGSMGTVVGEKIKRVYTRSAERRVPAVIVSSSGGARMHEGILSLMQMAKTCASLSLLRDKGVPFISILTHPTTGGVAASFAMLGDINIGEPGALIGFAGPRVIQQTIGQALPKGFQTSEFLLDHGMLDMICDRRKLRETITRILSVIHARA